MPTAEDLQGKPWQVVAKARLGLVERNEAGKLVDSPNADLWRRQGGETGAEWTARVTPALRGWVANLPANTDPFRPGFKPFEVVKPDEAVNLLMYATDTQAMPLVVSRDDKVVVTGLGEKLRPGYIEMVAKQALQVHPVLREQFTTAALNKFPAFLVAYQQQAATKFPTPATDAATLGQIEQYVVSDARRFLADFDLPNYFGFPTTTPVTTQMAQARATGGFGQLPVSAAEAGATAIEQARLQGVDITRGIVWESQMRAEREAVARTATQKQERAAYYFGAPEGLVMQFPDLFEEWVAPRRRNATPAATPDTPPDRVAVDARPFAEFVKSRLPDQVDARPSPAPIGPRMATWRLPSIFGRR